MFKAKVNPFSIEDNVNTLVALEEEILNSEFSLETL